MAKYVVEFSKTGTICYTSHLDIMRMFKRIFKRADIRLAYSQGFNPHPKMGFAQPLSLGYEGIREFIEFETVEGMDEEEILARLKAIMPAGIELKRCISGDHLRKTLSAMTEAAKYSAFLPAHGMKPETAKNILTGYIEQDKIITLKKQKKKKELKEVDIKPMIRELDVDSEGETLMLHMTLDQGSTSNLSPELVIKTFIDFAGLDIQRSDVAVRRDEIIFADGLLI